MKIVKLTPWIYIAGLIVLLTCLTVTIWKYRKEFPYDHIRHDLFNIWWILVIISTLLLVDRVHIYLCLP